MKKRDSGYQAYYQAYMVRLWRFEGGASSAWRVWLEDAHTGERRGFPDVAALYTFLEEQTGCGTMAANADDADGEHKSQAAPPDEEW